VCPKQRINYLLILIDNRKTRRKGRTLLLNLKRAGREDFLQAAPLSSSEGGVLALPLMWESPCLIEKDPYLLELAKRRKDARGNPSII
jgi:hypothetical protein